MWYFFGSDCVNGLLVRWIVEQPPDQMELVMATEKQIAANRRNAAASTGPKTTEGKAKSRANALTHGLTAVVLLPIGQKEASVLRFAAWSKSVKPEDELQEFQLQTAVEASFRMENCRIRELERKIELAEIATESESRWELDRKKEASRLGHSLKRNPEEIALQLRSTPAGRHWLIERWKVLLKAVAEDQSTAWHAPESNEALDLMGKTKLLRNLPDQNNRFTDPESIRALILQEIAAIEVEQELDVREDDQLRSLHARGLIFETDSKLPLIRRYETTAHRQFEKAFLAIQKAQSLIKYVPPTAVIGHREALVCKSKPLSPAVVAQAGSVVVAGQKEGPYDKPKPISPLTMLQVALPDLTPGVGLAAEVLKTLLPGNRRYRRLQQRESRHQKYLTRIAG